MIKSVYVMIIEIVVYPHYDLYGYEVIGVFPY